jgi:hypothetical protein
MANENIVKEVRYLGRDFNDYRNNLINFAKVYFPTVYKNFNESSVGMMFIEMASYVGDSLSYYIDNSLKESMLLYAEEEQNIYALAQTLGYTPALSVPAIADLDIYHIVPAVGSGANVVPDFRYSLIVNSGMQIASKTDSSVIFRTLEDVNFAHSSSDDPTTATVWETDNDGNPTFFVLKKTTQTAAGEIRTADFTFSDPKRFEKKVISETDVVQILDASDSDANTWYHVPYLAQDTVFTELRNVAAFDKDLAQYNDTAPYLLKLKKSARRFTSRIRGDKKTEVQFGAGVSDNPDELLIPNPTNIGSTLFGSVTFTDTPIDPANFLHTKTYGQAPTDTTVSVRYVVGGGILSNINQDELTEIKDVTFTIDDDVLDASTLAQVKNSIACNNPGAATGGRDGESVEEIRMNALSTFPTQLRAATKEDYITRAYSMPPRYGKLAKAYIIQDDQLSESPDTAHVEGADRTRVPNPLALNLYLLGYDKNKKLTELNQAVKENLKVYLGQYRLLTDAINIKDGFIVNIGVNFSIIAFKNFNKREVLLRCIDQLKSFFDIEKWQFNQPIVLADIQTELFKVEGVQAVVSSEVVNKWKASEGYSGNVYNIAEATKDQIIYPSLDPSIFELKYPNTDIEGRAL